MKKAVVAIREKLFGEVDADAARDAADQANHARNSLKHWKAGEPEIVKYDLPEEARDMLNRAIDNYWNFKENLTPSMEKFQHHMRRR
jgi:hypothetical protein